jgi:hypothetical protein
VPSFSFIRKSNASSTPDFFNRNSEKERRLKGYQKSWEAYLSELPDPLVQEDAANDNVKVNPVRAIIEVGVYFLFGDEVRFEVAPNKSTELGLKKPGKDMKSKAFNPPKFPGADPEYDEERQAEKDDRFEGDKEKRRQEYQDSYDRDREQERDDAGGGDEKRPQRGDDEKKRSQGGGGDDNERDNERYDARKDKDNRDQKKQGGKEQYDKAPSGTYPKANKDKFGSDGGDDKFGGKDYGHDQYGVDMEIPEEPKYLVDLNRCWKANEKKSLLNNMGRSGAIHGDIFIKMIPKGAGLKGDLPRIILLDPANVDVLTDPDDCNLVTKYVITYNIEDEDGKILTREQEITPIKEEDEWGNQLISSWEIKDYESSWTYDNTLGWHPGVEQRAQIGTTKKWEYPWPPIEHCNNMELPHMFWGQPDIDESAIETVQSVQRTMSSLTKIVRIHGNPRMFAKGVMPELSSEIDCSADNIITLPAGAGVDSDLKILEALQNVSSFVEYIESLRSQLFEQLQCPPIALGQIDTMSMSMSGINLSILYAPLLQKTEMKRIPYGDMLDRLNHKLLMLMGHENEEEYEDLTVVWPESMPGSHYLERQTLMEDIKLGVSNWTALQRLGYDPERESQKKAEEYRSQQQMQFDFQAQEMELQSKMFPDQQAAGGGKDPNFDSKGGGGGKGGNNNPSGFGNRGGSMGAQGNSTSKNKNNPSTSKSRGGPNRG